MVIKRRQKSNLILKPAVVIEHTGFYAYFIKFIESLKVQGQSPDTLRRRESDLRRFIGWCDDRGIEQPNEVTRPILESYQRYLFYYRQEHTNKPLGVRTQNQYVVSIKQWFKWLVRQNYLLFNPASDLIMMRPPKTLPVVLSEDEVMALLNQPNISKALGIRDRAILELFYSTGLRRSELCRLELQDISFSRQTVFVRQGKGSKDRLIPVGERALGWLGRYVNGVRNQLLLSVDNPTLFLNDYGEVFNDVKLGSRVKRYMIKAGLDVPGSCHLLRHAMATHMLENGAEMRFIQAMLGHARLTSTQVYTHVSIRKLQQVHAETHPAKSKAPEE